MSGFVRVVGCVYNVIRPSQYSPGNAELLAQDKWFPVRDKKPHDFGAIDVQMERKIGFRDEVCDPTMLVSQMAQKLEFMKICLVAWNSIWMHGCIKPLNFCF